MSHEPYYEPLQNIPLPPKNATVLTTACDYCIVACGYKVYRWPVDGKDGGVKASQNALNRDFPIGMTQGNWVSPNMYNRVMHDGKEHHILIVPDADTKVVNIGGDHSVRGGAIAQKCYSERTATHDRLKTPLLRVNRRLVPISWDEATDIFAGVSKHVIDKHGSHAWIQKRYSYGFFENTYALSKFSWVSVGTVATAEHDNPGHFSSTPGWRDSGFENFAAAYEDYYLADTVFITGTDPYETKTILFTEWIMRGVKERGNKLIMVAPRRSQGAIYAEQSGGLFLQINPGTDTLLHLALIRYIIEQGWQDQEFIEKYTGNKWESNSGFGQGVRNTPWQWRTTWGKFQSDGFDDYKKWLFEQKESQMEYASEVTGLAIADIKKAAELMAKPRNGERPKTTIGIEKGLYWSNNYLNTASIAAVALTIGSGNRPGRMVSRLGGHQRGGMTAGGYPRGRSPEKFAGRRRKGMDVDRWVENGKARFAWVVGTNWVGAMCGSEKLRKTFEDATFNNPNQVSKRDVDHAISRLCARADSGGMVVVEQNVYLTKWLGETMADLVLPASGWGENDLTRANGERRLRLYSKFMDSPGESKPDWQITAMLAKKMGFDGYDWKDSNDVFEEAARFGRGGVLNYHPLVKVAKKKGMRGHDLLRTYGTTGIQTPIRLEDGKLVGTKRLHDSTLELPETGPESHTVWIKKLKSFNTQSGRANFIKTPWFLFEDFYEEVKPKGDELWVINGRFNELWQSGYDDLRRPYIEQRWPENTIHINPEDAKARGIESGDYVMVSSDRIPVQVGGFVARDTKDALYAGLKRDGHIEYDKAEVKAIAVITKSLKPGVSYMVFLHNKDSANRLVARVPDPISNNYRFKLGFGKIKRVGESPYKKNLGMMSMTDPYIG